MKRERVKSRRGFKGFGVFVLGWFIGFISTLGILFGVGFWAYTSISVKRVEKWTKSNITDNEGVESLTLKKVVGIIQSVSKSSNGYSLNNIEEDFGVNLLGDSLYGVSTSTIKNSPIKDLKTAIDDTIDTITFNNVIDFLELDEEGMGLLNTILQSKVTYYVYNGKMYTDENHQIEVDFKYTIDGDYAKFANGTHTISSDMLSPRLSDLPLTTAINSLESSTKGLKIYEILDYERTGTDGNYTYTNNGQSISGTMKAFAEFTLDDLSKESTINDICIYEIMGYTREGEEGNYTYFDGDNKVTGIMDGIAGLTIGEISNSNKMDNMCLYEIMGYTREETAVEGEYIYKDNGKEVTGAMKSLAGKKIKELTGQSAIDELYVYEIMGYTREGEEGSYTYLEGKKQVSGIMATLAGKTIGQLDDSGVFDDVTVADAMGYYKNPDDGKYYKKYDTETGVYSEPVTGIYVHIADAEVSKLSERIKALQVGQVLDIEKDSAPGVIKALYTTPIDELGKTETINNIYIYQVMDYTPIGNGRYTYKEGNDTKQVTGAMKVLAGKTIGQLSNPNTIGDLKVYEVLGYYKNTSDNKYYKTFDGTNYSDEVTGPIKALIDKSISELNDETYGINSIKLGDLLDVSDSDKGVLNALKDTKLGELKGAIKDLQICQVMGYYKNPDDGKYYKKYDTETKVYSEPITGIMSALAETNVNEVGGKIETLRAGEIFSKDEVAILKLFSDEELNDTNPETAVTIMNLPNKVFDKINNATIETLVSNGIITGVAQGDYYNSIKHLKLSQILSGPIS
ncbi:MAG: hypothetical protein ACLRFE_00280 [Clostridia bacterium]